MKAFLFRKIIRILIIKFGKGEINVKDQLLKLKEAALEDIKATSAMEELDSTRVKYLGKKVN